MKIQAQIASLVIIAGSLVAWRVLAKQAKGNSATSHWPLGNREKAMKILWNVPSPCPLPQGERGKRNSYITDYVTGYVTQKKEVNKK